MKICNRIQRLIDEAEAASPPAFEVSLHLDSCRACRAFADERTRLRALLGTLPGITVPANFNGQLQARLEEAKARPSFAGFSPAVYLRFGAATAVFLVAVFAAQYLGIFTNRQPIPNTNVATTRDTPQPAREEFAKPSPVTVPPPVQAGGMAGASLRSRDVAQQPISTTSRRINRINPQRNAGDVADEFDLPDGSVRPFSVGAQDRIYMRPDNATPVRTVSF